MQRILKTLLTVLMVHMAAPFIHAEEVNPGTAFQLMCQFSLGYAHNPDLAELAKNVGTIYAVVANDLAADNGDIGGWEARDKTIPISAGIDLEPRFYFVNIGLGVSAGYHFTEAKTDVTSSLWSDKATVKMQLFLMPLTGTLYYRTAISDSGSVVLGAGAGYYIATIKHETKGSGVFDDINETARANGIGYHAKIEYHFLMDASTVLFGGLLGRYAEIEEFKASGLTVKNEDGSNLSAGLTGVSMYLGAGLSL